VPGCFLVPDALHTCPSTPEVLGSAELVDERASEDEEILQDDRDAGPLRAIAAGDDVSGEEDPHGGDDGGEAQQEPEEEPDARAALPHTARVVEVAADVAFDTAFIMKNDKVPTTPQVW